jgi:hypothetical protein
MYPDDTIRDYTTEIASDQIITPEHEAQNIPSLSDQNASSSTIQFTVPQHNPSCSSSSLDWLSSHVDSESSLDAAPNHCQDDNDEDNEIYTSLQNIRKRRDHPTSSPSLTSKQRNE